MSFLKFLIQFVFSILKSSITLKIDHLWDQQFFAVYDPKHAAFLVWPKWVGKLRRAKIKIDFKQIQNKRIKFLIRGDQAFFGTFWCDKEFMWVFIF